MALSLEVFPTGAALEHAKGGGDSVRSRFARISRLFWTLIVIAVASRSQPGVDPDGLLAAATRQIEQTIDQQKRFTCEATVARELYRTNPSETGRNTAGGPYHSGASLLWRDRLRVEVAVFGGRQFFSWPGGGSFHFESLDDMTGTGASETGDFGPFALSFLADSDPASVRFRGISEWDGQPLAEYSYEVPLASSHYEIKVGEHEFDRTAYQGSMFVDAHTGDLRRLVIRVLSPPPETDVERAEVDTTYEPRGTGEERGLFPNESVLTVTLNGGHRATNRTAYKSCHLFSSESTIHFGNSGPAREQRSSQTRARLPAGLEVQSTPITPIDSRTAAAGDLFQARVVAPVRQGKQTLVPKGAVLRAQIVGVEQQYAPKVSVRLMLKFSSVDFEGKALPISLAARATVPAPGPLAPNPPGDWTFKDDRAPHKADGEGESDHVASIWVFGRDRVRFDKHTVMRWETE